MDNTITTDRLVLKINLWYERAIVSECTISIRVEWINILKSMCCYSTKCDYSDNNNKHNQWKIFGFITTPHQHFQGHALTLASWLCQLLLLELHDKKRHEWYLISTNVQVCVHALCVEQLPVQSGSTGLCIKWHTVLSASNLSQNPEGSGLGGPGSWAPVLRVLHYPLLAGISMTGHMVELNVRFHNVFPWSTGEGQYKRIHDITKIFAVLPFIC